MTGMDLIPHSHFGMPGDIQRYTLVSTVVKGSADLPLIVGVSLGAIGVVFGFECFFLQHGRRQEKDAGGGRHPLHPDDDSG